MRSLRIAAVAFQAAVLALGVPASVAGHTSGGFSKWEGWSEGGYSYNVMVCDTNLSSGAAARMNDARTEWNEIGGELFFTNTGWDAATCSSFWNGALNVVRVKMGPLGGNTLGFALTNLIFGQVDQVDITIDNDNTTTTYGSYTWYTGTGSPSSNQFDMESVMVHEFGHALAALGHSTENENYIMDDTLGDGGSPEGKEKDERIYLHDTALYSDNYGTSH